MFETKKIKSETLSEYLTEVRENLGLSVEEVAEKSGVLARFITALEEGKFHQLPPTVYVLGFLKNLAEVYSIPSEDLLRQFKKERQIDQNLITAAQRPSLPRKTWNALVITPKGLSLGLGLLFVFATVIYIIWQVFSINRTPMLEIYQPAERQIVRESYAAVSGKTDPGMTVTINDQSVFVDEEGNFRSQIGVGNGAKDLVFVAKNKFDKSTSRTITVIGNTETSMASTTAAADASAVSLEIQCTGQVSITVTVDAQKPQMVDCAPGSSLRYGAARQVFVSTKDAGSTKVIVNGKDYGVLGRPKEELKDIPFTADIAPVQE